jgi:hypothetical protein
MRGKSGVSSPECFHRCNTLSTNVWPLGNWRMSWRRVAACLAPTARRLSGALSSQRWVAVSKLRILFQQSRARTHTQTHTHAHMHLCVCTSATAMRKIDKRKRDTWDKCDVCVCVCVCVLCVCVWCVCMIERERKRDLPQEDGDSQCRSWWICA